MKIQIIPFHEGLIPQAAELLACRHQRDRAILVGLPARFEDPETASSAIRAALGRPHAAGFAALQGERLAGYLIGDLMIDNLWGRSGWVRPPGCAYDEVFGVEPLRDLYARLGQYWVAFGIFTHHVLVPVSDPVLIHAWFSLSFGIQHVHAIADLQALNPDMPAIPPGLELRKATREDRSYLCQMSDVIWRAHVQPPVWAIQPPEAVSENRQTWGDQVDEVDVTVWLALQDGKVLGSQGYWPPERPPEALFVPDNSVYMSLAGTQPVARGQGISALLSQCVQTDALAAGYRFIETNWRSTNLLADRFWPRMGYQPVAYRLVRGVDERIVWANGNTPDWTENATGGCE